MTEPSETRLQLQRWHAGDRGGLDRLLERDLGWIRSHVRRRLGPQLAALGDADDFVQDALLEVLEYGPRFVVSDRDQFRGLLARITENVLRDRLRRARAGVRDQRRQRPLPSDSMLELDPPADRAPTRPSAAAARGHDRAWVQLAVELLPPVDRSLVRLRDWEERSFAAIGAELGLAEDAVRMRYRRLLPRIARQVRALRAGHLPEVLGDGGEAADAGSAPDDAER